MAESEQEGRTEEGVTAVTSSTGSNEASWHLPACISWLVDSQLDKSPVVIHTSIIRYLLQRFYSNGSLSESSWSRATILMVMNNTLVSLMEGVSGFGAQSRNHTFSDFLFLFFYCVSVHTSEKRDAGLRNACFLAVQWDQDLQVKIYREGF